MQQQLVLLVSLFAVTVLASPGYQSSIPNGARVSCPPGAQGCTGAGADALCPGVGHGLGTNAPVCGGGGSRNAFGEAFADANHIWTDALCRADSDGDGQYNGRELGDICCTGVSNPHRTSDISHPGASGSMTADTTDCLLQPILDPTATFVSATATAAIFSVFSPSCTCSVIAGWPGIDGDRYPFGPGFTSNIRVFGLPVQSTTSVTFRVESLALNQGPASPAVSVTTTAATVPEAPASVVALNIKATEARIQWTAPRETGGANIASYEITLSGGSSASATATATDTSVAFTGLVEGSDYSIEVKATSSIGQSAAGTGNFKTTQEASSASRVVAAAGVLVLTAVALF